VSLADDLALALRAQSIRIYPMAGKAAIGVEVPNQERATVTIHDIIGSDNFQRGSSFLTLCLGKDIFGNPVVTDLAKMPHLLVAGATGSGKSVSINTMIVSILYKASPADVKMLMIDPKLLELSAYAEIPHLISPVITGPKEASEALKKMVYEMERRYRLLAEKGARNIEGYNRQAAPEERLPYIVVFIDELADLMFTAPSDVENAIARLAQMARASGIHLILATQRPSVDVITGLIKANFPARISFRVTSKIDSRTILDAQGAEQLLGMGDMLFMLPGARITRIHGAYISDEEVRAVTDFVKSQGKPDYAPFEEIVLAAAEEKGVSEPAERDEMYQRVLDLAESAGEISISAIQRRLKIGFNRAARIMELLEEDGLVGPPRGAGKPRDFLGRR
jgi:S-DNA-T family DNA segregation ATPase FtsK/SpoIIIE